MADRLVLLLLAALAAGGAGCESCDCNGNGDGDADSDVDGDSDGDGDGDGDSDGDGGDGGGPFAFVLHAFEQDAEGVRGEALSGVAVAVDTAEGRVETETDGEGRAEVSLASEPGWLTATLATSGHSVVTLYRATPADLEGWEDAEGEVAVDLPSLDAGGAEEWIQVTVTAEGVPAGAQYCASAAPFLVTCGGGGDDAVFDRVASPESFRVTGFVVDADGALVDYSEDQVADGLDDRAAHLVFDGAPDLTLSSVDIRLTLPEDPESPFRTDGVYLGGPFPVIVMERGTYLVRGGATAEAEVAGETAYDMRVGWFAAPEEQLVHGFALYPGTDFVTHSYRWFPADLEDGTYDFIDVPRVSSPGEGGDLSSTFSFQSIEGADRYGLSILDGDGLLLWSVLSDRETTVELPDLPSAYDPTMDWPEDGTAGGFRVYAWQSPFAEGDPDEPLLVDRQESATDVFELALGR